MCKPTVCILAAVERELRPLRDGATGSLWHRELVVTGVGKASGALAAADALRQFQPTLLMNVGCAGAFRPSTDPVPDDALPKIGDVVLATSDVFADEGSLTPDGFQDLAAMKLPVLQDDVGTVYNEIPLFTPPAPLWQQIQAAVVGSFATFAGRLVTVSTCSGTDARAAELSMRWSGLAENMEGAAVALAGRRFGYPVVEIRGISNYVGDRTRGAWEIDSACEHAADVVNRLLTSPLLLDALGDA